MDGFAYDNPAGIAWKNLPVDTSYQNSYTISSSSWAGGIETLNVTGLPNIQSLMGAFQLSWSQFGLHCRCYVRVQQRNTDDRIEFDHRSLCTGLKSWRELHRCDAIP